MLRAGSLPGEIYCRKTESGKAAASHFERLCRYRAARIRICVHNRDTDRFLSPPRLQARKTVKRNFTKKCPLLSPCVTSCPLMSQSIWPQRSFDINSWYNARMKTTCGKALRRSAGFLTCCIADFQSASRSRRNESKTGPFRAQKGWGDVQFSKPNKTE